MALVFRLERPQGGGSGVDWLVVCGYCTGVVLIGWLFLGTVIAINLDGTPGVELVRYRN